MKYTLSAILFSAFCAVSNAVVLDDFSDGNLNDTISSGLNHTLTAATVPGGFRYAGHSITANPFNLTHSIIVTNGIFAAASESSVDTLSVFGYGFDAVGVPGANDLNMDLSGQSQFTLDVLSNDEQGTVAIAVRSSGVNGGSYIYSNIKPLATGITSGFQSITFDFSEFAGMNFADVDSIGVIVDNSASGDAVFDNFEAVPEPATLGLAALGLGALARRRKNKNKAQGKNKMKSSMKIGGLFLGVVALVGTSSAVTLVDDFTTGAANFGINTGTVVNFQNGSMLGGDRMVQLTVTNNNFGLELSINSAAGTFSVNSQPAVDGYAQLGYGYMDNGSGGASFDDLNFDLSGENGFEIDVVSSDEPAVITIAVRSASNPNNIVMVSKNVAGNMVNSNQLISWNFSEFAGVDFTNVDQVLVEIETGESGDITIGEVRAVPEPSILLGIGAAAALLMRRKRK